ncbi:hypothetical protein [Pseudofrankia sp. BMG5.37]|uniref:AMIN-like domain-containing (lipo)protein n=1 Tax=Pseudofrankia sp. BMG5.37 TaxID=3050035 RepID=UPI0028940777|nr:hypothetical protein [Pseudofrankia sp. BMG5.37]MDT3443687.1 hypothetical protein [Pseudofrankia sp. BMG5.37]
MPALVLLVGALSACSDDGGSPSPEPASTTSAAATSAPAGESATPAASPGAGASPTSGAGGAAPTWSSGPTSLTRSTSPSPRLVEVRAAHNVEGGLSFDRIVLEFTGGLPGYSARYVDDVVRPGEGSPLALTGQAHFEIVLHPADAHDDSGRSTLRSPVSGGGLPAVRQVAMAGDFEGYVHLGVGLDDVVGYRVTELTGPDRLIFDFAA